MKPTLPIPLGQLRPTARNDLDHVVELLQDEQVRRYLCDDTILPRETVAEILERSEHLDPDGLGLWAIEHARGGFAGLAGLEPVSAEADVAATMTGGIEPTVALSPSCWGQGLARQALDALVHYAREDLKLSRLVATVDLPNEPSHRMMEHCGFTVMGIAPGPANDLKLYELPL